MLFLLIVVNHPTMLALQASISEAKLLQEIKESLSGKVEPATSDEAAATSMVATGVADVRQSISRVDGPARRLFPDSTYAFSGAAKFESTFSQFGSQGMLQSSTQGWRSTGGQTFSFGGPKQVSEPPASCPHEPMSIAEDSEDLDQEVV